jgi:hypothetical protein
MKSIIYLYINNVGGEAPSKVQTEYTRDVSGDDSTSIFR